MSKTTTFHSVKADILETLAVMPERRRRRDNEPTGRRKVVGGTVKPNGQRKEE